MFETSEAQNLFRIHWIVWRVLGIPLEQHTSYRFYLYSIFVNIFFFILYPMHLLLGVLQSESQYHFFKNLAICLPVMICVAKFYVLWWNMENIRKFEQILENCEKTISSVDELAYYKNATIPAGKAMLNLFYFICIGAAVSLELGVLALRVLTGKWELLFPAYFPFDVKESTFNYIIAHIFQLLSECMTCAANFNNDTYCVINIALLSGHVHMLGMRVALIGQNDKRNLIENNKQLVKCIQEHQTLLNYHSSLQDVVSLFSLFQLGITCVAICVVIIYVLYFIDDMVSYIYYAVFLFGNFMEVFPICHQGSLFEYEMENLTKCLFDCNWVEQSKEFKQNLQIFTEQTLRQRSFKAGKMLGINYGTFLGTCKMAYSLFAMIMQTKK